MNKEVIIYQATKVPSSLQTRFPRFKKTSIRLGNFLLLIALIGLLFTFGPLLKSEINYHVQKRVQKVAKGGFGKLLKMEMMSLEQTAPDVIFSLVIPKINARSKIIANVDTSNRAEYAQALKKGVAHAKGTVFPGMKGTIYLFAHSTDAPWNIARYNAVFYLLRELEPGDQIVVFWAGKKYLYRVSERKIVEPTETSFFGQREEELLVLQTCWPPGTTQKGLLIFAKPW